MSQALHILRKDLRRLWPEIAVTLTVTWLLAWLNGDNGLVNPAARREQLLAGIGNMLMPLNVLAWCILIFRLIHDEALPGARQFWLTRPYRRGALLAAKVLFVLLVLNLPTLVGDMMAAARAGVPLEWGGLLWKQVLYVAIFLMPAVALAAVTASLAESVFGVIGLLLAVQGLSMFPQAGYARLGGGLGWWVFGLHVALAAVVGVAVCYAQYFRRSTPYSRGLIVVANLLFFFLTARIPASTLHGWQQRMAREPAAGSTLAVSPALERGRLAPAQYRRSHAEYALVALPISARVPDGLELVSDDVEISLRGPDGSQVAVEGGAAWIEREGQPWLQWPMEREWFRRVRAVPHAVDATVYVTLLGRPRTASMPFGGPFRLLNWFGACRSEVNAFNVAVWCREAFSPALWTRVRLRDKDTGARSQPLWLSRASYAPFHTDPGISPLNNSVAHFNLAGANGQSQPSWDERRLGATAVEFAGF